MSKYEADPEDPMAKFSRSQPKVISSKMDQIEPKGEYAKFWAKGIKYLTQVKKDLSSAKERVKEALKREQEERNGPRKRRSVKLMHLNLLPKNNTRAEANISIYLSIRVPRCCSICCLKFPQFLHRSEMNIGLSQHIRCGSSNTTQTQADNISIWCSINIC